MGEARIGASPYDHVPCGGGFVERACEDYYIGCVDNIAKLAFDGYLVREQGLDEDGVEPGEVIVLEEYMEGVPQESRGLGTSDVHGV